MNDKIDRMPSIIKFKKYMKNVCSMKGNLIIDFKKFTNQYMMI